MTAAASARRRLGLPQSLVGRMTLLVAAVSGVSLLLHLGVMSLWVDSLAREFTAGLGGRVVLVRELIRLTPAAERAARAHALSVDRLQVRPATQALEPSSPPPALPGHVLEHLEAAVGPEIQVRLLAPQEQRPRGQVVFGFEVEGQRWRVSYDTEPPLTAVLGTGLGWLALLALAVFVSLAMGVRMIARPMSRLAEQLGTQGGALRKLTLSPQSGQELQSLVAAFNRLVDAVRRADETKQHLLAGVSHDLRTPLARLRLRIETQCDNGVAEALADDLRAVERIVSQFLIYVQGEGRAALGEPESARAMLSQAVHSYRSQGVSIRLLPGSDDVDLPDLALQRLLGNLIDNAAAHGREPVELALVCDDGHWQLTVWDHGAGLSEQEFAQAQQPFVRQVRPTDAAPDLGHCGLGLAIVAQIAEQLGARLQAVREGKKQGEEQGERQAEKEAERFGVRLSGARPPGL